MTLPSLGSVFPRRSARTLSAVLLIAAALTGCVTTSPQQQPKTESDKTDADRRAQVRLELASGYFARGQYETALDEVKLALAAKPDLPDAINLRSLMPGEIDKRTGEPVKAEPLNWTAHPNNPMAEVNQRVAPEAAPA